MVVFNTDEIVNAIIGGALISLASTLHLALKGKITGISGTLFNVIQGNNFFYNFLFILGMMLPGSALLAFSKSNYFDAPVSFATLPIFGFIFSGFLVGLGTKLGNGCTSGHGVCGLPRLSIRSITAVATFLTTGVAFATLKNYLGVLNTPQYISLIEEVETNQFHLICFGIIVSAMVCILIYRDDEARDLLISCVIGIIFGSGLIISGMNSRERVVSFLTISSGWNPALLFVLMTAVGINLITFNYILSSMDKPIFDTKMDMPTKTKIDLKLVVGAAIFGIGWGLSGLCPGPALICSFVYVPHTIVYLASLILGQVTGHRIGSYWDMITKALEGEKVVQ